MASSSRGGSMLDELSPQGVVSWIMFTSTTISIAALFNRFVCFRAIALCFVLAVTYVGSLYVWKSSSNVSLNRNHEAVIKKRFVSVTFTSIFSPLILILNRHLTGDYEMTLAEALGFRLNSSLQAALLPLFLTMILFAGPLLLCVLDGVCALYVDPRYWISNFRNFIWLRNNVVAPLTEEFTFRSCMMPILIPCLGVKWSVLGSPLFFGIAHFHHMMDKIYHGVPWKDALLSSLFQFSYTTVFGVYSAFLFVRTGNFLAPFMAHAFCNHMGFPNLGELTAYKQPLRAVLGLVYVGGVVGWYYLLLPLTDPEWYYNSKRLYF